MRKFEYKTVLYVHLVKPYDSGFDIKKFNELGNDGWEYIDLISGECIFKREIKE